MLLKTVRADTLKLLGILCVALTVVITLIAFVPTYTALQTSASPEETSYSYDKVRSAEDAANFLSQFSIKVDRTPAEVKAVKIPDEFDKVFSAYNEIQKAQGLNLLRYRGKEVTRYTFRVTNYEGATSPVWANVLVYRNRVIGGDVYSTDFVKGFEG